MNTEVIRDEEQRTLRLLAERTYTHDDLRTINTALTDQTRLTAALIGATWFGIWRGDVWKEWGYKTVEEAIDKEAPRAASTIWEAIRDYHYYVIFPGGQTLEEFIDMVRRVGMAKVTIARQAELDKTKTADFVEQIASQKLSRQEAKVLVGLGTRVINTDEQWVPRHFTFPLDSDNIVQQAIAHMKDWRRKTDGGVTDCSDSAALTAICGLYMGEYGTRRVS